MHFLPLSSSWFIIPLLCVDGGAFAHTCSEPDQDIHLAGKTNKQMNKTKKSFEVLFVCFRVFCFSGVSGAVLLFDLPCYLAVQMVVLAQKKGCQEG